MHSHMLVKHPILPYFFILSRFTLQESFTWIPLGLLIQSSFNADYMIVYNTVANSLIKFDLQPNTILP